MSVNVAGEAAILGQEEGPAFLMLLPFSGSNLKTPEVIVYADKVSGTLIEPAACRVDEPCRILCADGLCNTYRIKLSPALVKRTPDGNGGEEFQVINHIGQLFFPFVTGIFILSCKKMVSLIRDVACQRRAYRGQIVDKRHPVLTAAVNHILADDHAKAVTVVIPPCRFYLQVLTHHIEAQLFHGCDIIKQCFIGGGRH